MGTEVERLLEQKATQAAQAEGDHRPSFWLDGDTLTVDLSTYHGRQAARMLAHALALEDMRLAVALLARVGLES